MKYTYAYKSSDGVRHEASIEAASREAAFCALRERGIKPIKVVAADGSKANGEIRGVRKRVATAIAIAAALVAGGIAYFAGERGQTQVAARSSDDVKAAANSTPRHQIYGDPAVMEEFERGKFEEVLPREGDRILAWYAQPGKLMCPKGLKVREAAQLNNARLAALEAVVEGDVEIADGDSREVRELKQIVNGMREEMREYLANGNGTVKSYARRLYERLREEMQIYERTKTELEKETDSAVFEAKNEGLRRLGLRTIPPPNDSISL